MHMSHYKCISHDFANTKICDRCIDSEISIYYATVPTPIYKVAITAQNLKPWQTFCIRLLLTFFTSDCNDEVQNYEHHECRHSYHLEQIIHSN